MSAIATFDLVERDRASVESPLVCTFRANVGALRPGALFASVVARSHGACVNFYQVNNVFHTRRTRNISFSSEDERSSSDSDSDDDFAPAVPVFVNRDNTATAVRVCGRIFSREDDGEYREVPADSKERDTVTFVRCAGGVWRPKRFDAAVRWLPVDSARAFFNQTLVVDPLVEPNVDPDAALLTNDEPTLLVRAARLLVRYRPRAARDDAAVASRCGDPLVGRDLVLQVDNGRQRGVASSPDGALVRFSQLAQLACAAAEQAGLGHECATRYVTNIKRRHNVFVLEFGDECIELTPRFDALVAELNLPGARNELLDTPWHAERDNLPMGVGWASAYAAAKRRSNEQRGATEAGDATEAETGDAVEDAQEAEVEDAADDTADDKVDDMADDTVDDAVDDTADDSSSSSSSDYDCVQPSDLNASPVDYADWLARKADGKPSYRLRMADGSSVVVTPADLHSLETDQLLSDTMNDFGWQSVVCNTPAFVLPTSVVKVFRTYPAADGIIEVPANCRFVVFPEHDKKHYTVSVVDVCARTVAHYDSLSSAVPRRSPVLQWAQRRWPDGDTRWKTTAPPFGQVQTGGTSCAFLAFDFVSRYLRAASGAPTPPSRPAGVLRRELAAAVCQQLVASGELRDPRLVPADREMEVDEPRADPVERVAQPVQLNVVRGRSLAHVRGCEGETVNVEFVLCDDDDSEERRVFQGEIQAVRKLGVSETNYYVFFPEDQDARWCVRAELMPAVIEPSATCAVRVVESVELSVSTTQRSVRVARVVESVALIVTVTRSNARIARVVDALGPVVVTHEPAPQPEADSNNEEDIDDVDMEDDDDDDDATISAESSPTPNDPPPAPDADDSTDSADASITLDDSMLANDDGGIDWSVLTAGDADLSLEAAAFFQASATDEPNLHFGQVAEQPAKRQAGSQRRHIARPIYAECPCDGPDRDTVVCRFCRARLCSACTNEEICQPCETIYNERLRQTESSAPRAGSKRRRV